GIAILSIDIMRGSADVFICAFTSVVGFLLFPVWLLQGLEKLVNVAAIQFLSRLFGVLLVFMFVDNEGDAALALLLQGGSAAFAGILSLVWIWRNRLVRPMMPTITGMRSVGMEGASLFF